MALAVPKPNIGKKSKVHSNVAKTSNFRIGFVKRQIKNIRYAAERTILTLAVIVFVRLVSVCLHANTN